MPMLMGLTHTCCLLTIPRITHTEDYVLLTDQTELLLLEVRSGLHKRPDDSACLLLIL